ncbi:MAG: hypothetical protein WCA96_04705, partial [Methylocella sp.]
MQIAIQEQMDIAIKKTQEPSPKASVRLLIHSAVIAMSMAMALPVRADGSWLDSINPMNLFKGEKYEPKVVPDVSAE